MTAFFFDHALSTATFLLTLVFAASALRAKKPAGSTMAWLLVILLSPAIGIPLYLILSGRKFPSRLARKKNLYLKDTHISDEQHGIRRILATSGVPPPRKNESVELIKNGEDAFAKYLELIENAKFSIHITTFIFGEDEVGGALISALTRRAAEGVDVKVIVDSLGAVLLRHPSLLQFEKSKGQMAFFMPLFHLPFRGRTNLRNHRKILVVDGEVALIGGMNLAKEYMGPTPDKKRWADFIVEIRGESVRDLEDVFIQDWNFSKKRKSPGMQEQITNVIRPQTGPSAQVIASGPDVLGDPLYDVLLSSISLAQKKIVIVTPYFIPDESLTKALELAAKRSVQVDILLPRRSNHLVADIARGSFIRQLQSAGVRFHFYPKMIHAKAVLIDASMGFLGSANFDMRSLLLNYEIGVLLDDANALRMVEDWVRLRIQKSSSDFPRETFIRQLAEGAGRVVGPLI